MATKNAKPLSGKTVFITGAAKRLGRAMALAAAKNGADVAITYRNSARDAGRTVVDASSFGVRAFAFQCDVTDEASILAVMKEACLLYTSDAADERSSVDLGG